MINYQEQKQIEQEMSSPKNHVIAIVGSVYSDGVSLKFEGEQTGSSKHYPYNKAVTFKAGDKVLLVKASGTYVVVCPI